MRMTTAVYLDTLISAKNAHHSSHVRLLYTKASYLKTINDWMIKIAGQTRKLKSLL